MDCPRELDGLVCVIGNVDVLRPTNVDVSAPTVFMLSGAIVDADTTDVEVVVKDEE